MHQGLQHASALLQTHPANVIFCGGRQWILTSELDLFDLDEENILYMGDDLPDYKVMRRVGMPCCPSDAVQEVKSVSFYISPKKGGDGCVRDVIEKVMKLNHQWPILGNAAVIGAKD